MDENKLKDILAGEFEQIKFSFKISNDFKLCILEKVIAKKITIFFEI